ncbi:hypothetical protein M431DRAFT_529341 [Trichoderma harzianum CBS 226.95]|uniref:Uncharacterized protein n=1 Tax=Trichoderma harzianum CBS 226.95 TaxID=983964 RepID=A0A2T4AHB6_TRIHA|nr:hypothetical protein M431DRAFT_529341 [Trichoderma harzianum CBS 226.95]PTB56485.1 hypothetical protein M431DRAFT_529341 [Trichoderma harzianum CBS 226.95]
MPSQSRPQPRVFGEMDETPTPPANSHAHTYFRRIRSSSGEWQLSCIGRLAADATRAPEYQSTSAVYSYRLQLRDVPTVPLVASRQTVTSRVHDRGTSTDLLGCIYAYPHTHLHARTAHTNNHTCILHARTELYPPRANANKAALVPYSCTGRDTSIENLPYPGLAECLPATSIVSTPNLIVINDSRIDTQSPMAIGKQMANDSKEREKENYNKAGLGSTSCASPLVLGLDIWPPPPQESARLVFHPISWRQLNNTYIRARLHTHTSCTCARTCIRTTYSYRHAQSGIKNDPPARAKLVKQPPAQRHRQTRAPICSKSPGYSCSCLCGPLFSLSMLWPHTAHATHTDKQNAVASQPYIFRLSQFTYTCYSVHTDKTYMPQSPAT